MVRSVQYSVSVSSRELLRVFKRECRSRGRTQAHVLTTAMRYFVEHPYSGGWGSKDGSFNKKRLRVGVGLKKSSSEGR